MTGWLILGTALGLSAAPPAANSGELLPPVKIMAGKEAINVEIGHAAPCFADFEGRGVKDLLVGQFGGGKLRIYRNTGTNEKPKFDKFTWFLDGKPEGTVPTS